MQLVPRAKKSNISRNRIICTSSKWTELKIKIHEILIHSHFRVVQQPIFHLKNVSLKYVYIMPKNMNKRNKNMDMFVKYTKWD